MATLSQMGVPGAGFGILHPKQRNRWQVTFVGLGRLVGGAENLTREITRQAINFTRPTLTFEEVPIHRYNSTAYIAGKYSWSTTNLTVEDDISGLASSAIQAQLETQQRLVGSDLPGQWMNAAATASDYKFGVILQMLDGNEGVTETWRLEGCYIMNCNWGELDYSDGTAVQVQLELRFDHANQQLSGQGYGTAIAGNL